MVNYDFDHPILKKDRKYRRYAREHIAISELVSDVIHWEVKEVQTALNIPVCYHVHYYVKSIIGIDETQAPIYGDKHTLEVSFPARYPLEPSKIIMLSSVWHPNIKYSGNYKGRICGNVKNFGKAYDLYQLVLRVGEILQYKNYHAEHVPPYPEDATVADWIVNYAEPNGIVDNQRDIILDDTPLIKRYAVDEGERFDNYSDQIQLEAPVKPKIKILNQKQKKFSKSKLVIKVKNKK